MDTLKQELDGGVHALSIHVSLLAHFLIRSTSTKQIPFAGQNVAAVDVLWRGGGQFTPVFRRLKGVKCTVVTEEFMILAVEPSIVGLHPLTLTANWWMESRLFKHVPCSYKKIGNLKQCFTIHM